MKGRNGSALGRKECRLSSHSAHAYNIYTHIRARGARPMQTASSAIPPLRHRPHDMTAPYQRIPDISRFDKIAPCTRHKNALQAAQKMPCRRHKSTLYMAAQKCQAPMTHVTTLLHSELHPVTNSTPSGIRNVHPCCTPHSMHHRKGRSAMIPPPHPILPVSRPVAIVSPIPHFRKPR